MSPPLHVLLISGSLRANSTNTALLRCLAAEPRPDVSATLYEGMGDLPHFSPDDDNTDAPPAPVADLRARLAAADAVLISTPEYAGSLPGSFKNLLDWAVGGGEIYDKPVAWVNASSSPTGARGAHATLEVVLGYVGARIIEPACAHVPVPRAAVDAAGNITDQEVRQRAHAALANLVELL